MSNYPSMSLSNKWVIAAVGIMALSIGAYAFLQYPEQGTITNETDQILVASEATPQDKYQCEKLADTLVQAALYDFEFAGEVGEVKVEKSHFNTEIENCVALLSLCKDNCSSRAVVLVNSSLEVKNKSNVGTEFARCSYDGSCISSFDDLYPRGPITSGQFETIVQHYLSE
jgi:hypothetical protein